MNLSDPTTAFSATSAILFSNPCEFAQTDLRVVGGTGRLFVRADSGFKGMSLELTFKTTVCHQVLLLGVALSNNFA